MRNKHFTQSTAWLVGLALLLLPGCSGGALAKAPADGTPAKAPAGGIPASGKIAQEVIHTTVDAEIAAYYLKHYLQGRRTRPQLDREIDGVYRRYDRPLPSREDLKEIAATYSVDFAALFLASRIGTTEANRRAQALFRQAVAVQKDAIEKGETLTRRDAFLILFVPGWDYIENGHLTGADLARPRKQMTALGIDNDLVNVPPNGGVEENAMVIRQAILRYGKTNEKGIILAGASSAGPAIHLALSELLTTQQTRAVKAWLNLGGILQGTPLIEYMQGWPQRWILRTILWFEEWNREALLSMSAGRGRERFQRLTLPRHILVINYLGLGLSGELSRYSRDKYPILKSQGPNDGLTLLADAIVPGGLTIVAPRSDHFFNEDPEIDLKTSALAQMLFAQLNQ